MKFYYEGMEIEAEDEDDFRLTVFELKCCDVYSAELRRILLGEESGDNVTNNSISDS